jgi:hypothetical protein
LLPRIFGVGGRAALPAGTSLRRRGGELLRRGATGGAVYGAAEGLTEVGQEAIAMGLSGQSLTDDAAVKRFVNAFAAGAAVGGTLGGMANLRSRKADPVNMLDTSGTETEAKTTPTAPIPTSAQMELPLEGGMVSVGPSEFRPEFMPTGMGQGVLDIGVPGQPLTELEMLARQEGLGAVQPTPELYGEQLDLFASPTGTVGPNVLQQPGQQMPFQFAPPAPETTPLNVPPPTTPFGQQLLSAQRQQEFQLAQQQLEAQRQADLDRLANVGQAQRQLDLAAQQAQPIAPQQFPMRQVPPPTPQQLPLFTPQQAPRPSRGEALRRGIPYAGLPEMTGPAVEPRVDLRRSAQVPLFTQAGEPSLAALRSVAQRVPITPVPEKGGRQRKPTGFRGKPLTAFQREAAEAYDALREPDQPTFAQLTPEQRELWYAEYKKFKDEQEAAAKAQAEAERKAKEEADAIQKRSTKKVSPRKPPEAGKGVGGKVRRAKEPTGKSEALKKGKTKKQEPSVPPVDRSYGEQVLKQYDALTDAQKDAVAQKLGLTRTQFIETEAVFERTEEVDEAIAAVKRETKKKSEETKVEKKEPPPPPTPSTSRELFDSTIETLETTKDHINTVWRCWCCLTTPTSLTVTTPRLVSQHKQLSLRTTCRRTQPSVMLWSPRCKTKPVSTPRKMLRCSKR